MNKPGTESTSPKTQRTRRPKSSLPKKLFAFANAKIIGIYKCSCNCVHYGISEQDALAYVANMNEYLSSLDTMEIRNSFGGRSISADPFKRCFFCSADGSAMTLIVGDERKYSISHQPVIVETILVDAS